MNLNNTFSKVYPSNEQVSTENTCKMNVRVLYWYGIALSRDFSRTRFEITASTRSIGICNHVTKIDYLRKGILHTTRI